MYFFTMIFKHSGTVSMLKIPNARFIPANNQPVCIKHYWIKISNSYQLRLKTRAILDMMALSISIINGWGQKHQGVQGLGFGCFRQD